MSFLSSPKPSEEFFFHLWLLSGKASRVLCVCVVSMSLAGPGLISGLTFPFLNSFCGISSLVLDTVLCVF